jgi:hypothetical protein
MASFYISRRECKGAMMKQVFPAINENTYQNPRFHRTELGLTLEGICFFLILITEVKFKISNGSTACFRVERL